MSAYVNGSYLLPQDVHLSRLVALTSKPLLSAWQLGSPFKTHQPHSTATLLPKTMFQFLFVLWHISLVFATQQSCSAKAIPYHTLFGAKILAAIRLRKAKLVLCPAKHHQSQLLQSEHHRHASRIQQLNPHSSLASIKSMEPTLPSYRWFGFIAGVFDQALAPVVAQGYSAVSTDGGHELNVTSAASW